MCTEDDNSMSNAFEQLKFLSGDGKKFLHVAIDAKVVISALSYFASLTIR